MLLMDYPSIIGEYLRNYAKKATWDLLHEYVDSHSHLLIYKYPRNGVQAIKILQSQCSNTTFSHQIISSRLFQKVIHKRGESEINYISKF